MKKELLYNLAILSLFVILFGCNKIADPVSPANQASKDGSISATINGTSWSGSFCSAAAIGMGTTGGVSVAIVGKQDKSSAKDQDQIIISIIGFAGPGTYTNNSNASVVSTADIVLIYKGKTYNYDSKAKPVPTVKITESTNPVSLLVPGKVVGEFSGTLKNIASGTETISITNGKFSAIRVL